MTDLTKLSPQEKIELVNETAGGKLKRVKKLIEHVMSNAGPLQPKAEEMLRAIDLYGSAFDNVSPCRDGCDACCRQALVIFDWEADRIAKASGRQRSDFKGRKIGPDWEMGQRQELVERYHGVVCPFLKDNQCSVYEVRPASCRLQISLEDSAEPCDMEKHPGGRVAYVNAEQMRYLWAMLFVMSERASGDIREFFDD